MLNTLSFPSEEQNLQSQSKERSLTKRERKLTKQSKKHESVEKHPSASVVDFTPPDAKVRECLRTWYADCNLREEVIAALALHLRPLCERSADKKRKKWNGQLL